MNPIPGRSLKYITFFNANVCILSHVIYPLREVLRPWSFRYYMHVWLTW